jgi:hypothetical protein
MKHPSDSESELDEEDTIAAVTTRVIEPTTFQLVAQCLNQKWKLR